jgi:hypothetical protein
MGNSAHRKRAIFESQGMPDHEADLEKNEARIGFRERIGKPKIQAE